jgi:hypothetical protein
MLPRTPPALGLAINSRTRALTPTWAQPDTAKAQWQAGMEPSRNDKEDRKIIVSIKTNRII